MVVFLKTIFPTCKQVKQDLFHVVQNLQRDFGSKEDPHFHRDVTMRLRSAMRGMHGGKKLQVVDLLKTGKLNVSTFFRREWYTCEYRSMPDDEIKMWIEVGVFRELFCSGSNPVVPYISYSEDQTRENIKEWSNGYMMPKYFPTGEQIRIDGKFRLGNVKTVATWNLKIGYFIERATKCILLRTLGLQEFKETERIDTKTLMAVVKQLYNTGTNESWHSRVEHIGGFGTATKANKHMLGLLGMVRVARIKEDNVRMSEALGNPPIGYDRWSASIVANRYAEAAGSTRRLPVPHLAGSEGDAVTTDMPVFLREFDGPVAKPKSQAAKRKAVQAPLKSMIPTAIPTGSFLHGVPPPAFAGPRTAPRSAVLTSFFGGAPAAKRQKQSTKRADPSESTANDRPCSSTIVRSHFSASPSPKCFAVSSRVLYR
jgi:hypothetical protein